jgi:predicted permease
VSDLIQDTIRDVLHALRAFARAPVVAVTIVATVALGLGLVTVAFTILNALLFRVDAVPNIHEMFALDRPATSGDELQDFTRTEFDALRRETDIFTDVYAEVSQVDTVADGRLSFGTFVTGNCFQVLGVSAALGRTLTLADDEPTAGEAVMVLSDRGWDRLFARDPAVLGRRLLVNGFSFEIVGVMPAGFRGLTVAPDDYWAPLSMLPRVRKMRRGRESTLGVEIIGRLRPGMSRQAAAAQLAVWDARQPRANPIERGASHITLVPRRGTVKQPLEVVPVTAPLFIAFGLILLIGCANVANLLLARAVARQREIGIQLSLGATGGRIMRQLLTESLLLAIAAAAGGLTISRVVLDLVIHTMITSMPPDIGDVRLWVPGADWRVLLFLLGGACLSTLAFGLAPALQSARIEPLRTMRGEIIGDARPGRARNFLIGVQVSASALLLISAAVFLRSAFAAATFDSGMRTADTVVIQIPNEETRNAIVQAVMAEASVREVAASGSDIARRAFAESNGARARITYRLVSPEYFGVLGIPVVRGRAFTPAERTSNLPLAVVSETTAGSMWPNADPIGQTIRLDPGHQSDSPRSDEPAFDPQTFTVVGVVRDVAGLRIARFEETVVYVPTNPTMPGTSLVARVHGDPESARQALSNRLTTIDPDMARQIVTMRTLARVDTYFLQVAFWLTIVLGGLALVLTLSGLFSVLSYLVEQRTREIGVRMALGATGRDVTRLILTQLLRPVGIGLFVGGGSAAALAIVLVATPAVAGVGEIVHVLDPVAYAVSVLIVTAACLMAGAIPATRAARLDPMKTLRQE